METGERKSSETKILRCDEFVDKRAPINYFSVTKQKKVKEVSDAE